MLRTLITLLFAAAFIVFGHAQQGQVAQLVAEARAKGEFSPVRLFGAAAQSAATNALWGSALQQCDVLRYDSQAAAQLLTQRSPRIALELPTAGGTDIVDLVLAPITSEGFRVIVSADGSAAEPAPGLHYRGTVRGTEGSLAAVSIFGNELMAIIGDARGNRVIGRFENDAEGLHASYWEHHLRGTFNGGCATSDAPITDTVDPRGGGAAKTIRCVSIYWEAAHDIYLGKGSSVANVTNYLTGLFNQMAVIYSNDGVQVQLSEIFVWTTPSPFDATSSSGRLGQFGTVRTSFNGNLAHLLDYGNYGGVAWLNSLCGGTSSRMAYSGINSNYNNVPTYSWSVMVVTHETGHNLGSPHTHQCSWNGDGTAIDGCGPTAGYSGGSCPNAGLPAGGGTVMSYCHLIGGTGINLALGFGPQPKALIINRVNSSSCLAQCGSSCDPPLPLNVSSLTAISATLSWANFGMGSYTLRWKPTSSGTWTTISGLAGTTYNLTSLTQGTEYEFQVLSVCSASSSAYSTSRVFTTPVPCTDPNEPNNSTGAATVIALPASINGLINPSGDADYFRFTIASTSTINMGLGNLVANFNLRLLDNAGAQLAVSQNSGTTSESISYANAAAGTYYAHVLGSGGASNSSVCYLLTVSAFITQCNTPQGLQAANVTWNGAAIAWNTGQPGSSNTWEMRWKLTSGSTWTTITGLSTGTYNLSALDPLTSYDVQVRAVCGGLQGTTSNWTSTVSFTTLEAPCEVVPRSVLAAKVFLDGAYRSAAGLMVDSLRKLSLLPLNEPYSALGHTVSGPTSIAPAILAITGVNAPVDWVLVELRQNSSPFNVVEARVGIVQRDGDIVATDGASPLGFCASAGSYRVAVRHRNHLGAMTGSGIALGSTSTALNFTLAATSTYGTGARKSIGAVEALWAGNVDGNGMLKYTGELNDRDPILAAVGGSVPTSTAVLYHPADVNMDGTVKYTGDGNDRDPILLNVGGSVPTNTLIQQLP